MKYNLRSTKGQVLNISRRDISRTNISRDKINKAFRNRKTGDLDKKYFGKVCRMNNVEWENHVNSTLNHQSKPHEQSLAVKTSDGTIDYKDTAMSKYIEKLHK